jgi:predicted benzoate:H+ symporter BenE
MNVFTNPNQIHINYGLKIAVGLIVYFLIMKFTGLLNVVELRLLNLVIQVAGIYVALRQLKRTHEDHMNYFRALVTGVATASLGAIIFGAFLFIYMEFLDTSFMQFLIDNEPMGRFLNPYMASFIVVLEGVFSGLLVTFVLINYIDTDAPSEN